MIKAKSKRIDIVFNFIVAYKTKHDGNSPTTREIGAACGISSTSMVNYYLDRLAQAGRITIEPGMNRMISVTGGIWKLMEAK